MKRIDSLTVAQLRIFKTDELPFNSLRLGASVQKIRTEFAFKHITNIPAPMTPDLLGAIGFVAGEVKTEAGATVIESLVIESRRVLLTIHGPSEVANQTFDRLRGMIREVDQRENKPELVPLIVTEDTTTVVHLDHPILSLLTGCPLEQLVGGLDSKIEKHGARVRIYPASFRLAVAYDHVPDSLKLNNITLADKVISIELRMGTAVEDNIYFISSPNPSTIHLQMVTFLEELLARR
jgi:hypothetical protein